MTEKKNAFQEAGNEQRESLLSEFVHFLKTNKRWWLLPILLIIAALALLTFFGSTGAAPFIYTMF